MADAAVGQIYSVIFRGQCLGQKLINTFAYRLKTLDGAPTVATVSDGINDVLNNVGNLQEKFLDVTPGNYFLDQTWIQVVAPIRLVKRIYLTSETGNWVGDAETANLQAAVTRRGEVANKRNVGGVHPLISTATNVMDGGLITAAMKTALDALGVAMLQTITIPTTTTVLEPVLFNKGATPNYTLLTSVQSQLQVRTMRRRTVGLGE